MSPDYSDQPSMYRLPKWDAGDYFFWLYLVPMGTLAILAAIMDIILSC